MKNDKETMETRRRIEITRVRSLEVKIIMFAGKLKSGKRRVSCIYSRARLRYFQVSVASQRRLPFKPDYI